MKMVFIFLLKHSVTIAILGTMAVLLAGCDVPLIPLI